MKITVFDYKGIKGKEISLPKEFAQDTKLGLLWQALHVYRDKSHTGSSKVKTRAEISRTKKKWYKQKGTGGARHGARSAPIFVGGGVAHGPNTDRRFLGLPKIMRKKARNLAIKLKSTENNILAVSGVEKLTKTKEVGELLKKLGVLGESIIFAVTPKNYASFNKVARNIEKLTVTTYQNLNAYKIFVNKKIIFDKGVFESPKGKK